ncbi:MAG TPA: hypothetical protein VE733_17660 [Streptosporangiaceae bacterium]|nr:hypothetical protein [Streptosporangiaceae bacterium]
MADAVPAHVVEALDTEVRDELPRPRPALGVLERRRRHGVVHDDRDLVRVMDARGLHP